MTELDVASVADSLVPVAVRRATSAEQAADAIRDAIVAGKLLPEMRLSEESLTVALGVSRNTLREGFKTLIHEGLLVHRINRGVFVTQITAEDVWDVYRTRSLIECNAVRNAAPTPLQLARIEEAVSFAYQSAAADDWHGVGAANGDFHRALVALANSPRQDRLISQLIAESMLHNAMANNQRGWREPYIGRNKAVLEYIQEGNYAQAAVELDEYLKETCESVAKQYS